MKIEIDESRCKGCNLCTVGCPYRIFQPGKTAKPERCPGSGA